MLGYGLATAAEAACSLQQNGAKIKHVIHITFDNVHLRRDNPNVPSDIEQMPNLLQGEANYASFTLCLLGSFCQIQS